MIRDLLRVPPGPVDISTFDTRATPGAPGDKDETEAAFADDAAELFDLQERLFAEGTVEGARRRVLVVLQGMDTSGKGGAIKHVVGAMNPIAVRIASFKKPTKEELSHHFLWRIRKQVPEPGRIGIFDRSHYEDVLVVRVHDLAPWEERYEEIDAFERELTDDGVTIVKCWLNISPDEQRERLLARIDDPTKRWKFNVGDLDEREHWDEYMEAYAAALERCSSVPWHVIPADRKWYRNWALMQVLLETLRELDPQWPERDDLDDAEIRRRLGD